MKWHRNIKDLWGLLHQWYLMDGVTVICYWVYVRKDRLICISGKKLIFHLRGWVYSAYLDDSVHSTDNIQENYLKCNENNVIQD